MTRQITEMTSEFSFFPAQEAVEPDRLIDKAERHVEDVLFGRREQSSEPLVGASTFVEKPVSSVAYPIASSGLTLEDLGDIELDISIELGRTDILIEDVLKLREGSVVALDKFSGDPVDIMANGRLVARGELLVIEGKFGVRLSEIL